MTVAVRQVSLHFADAAEAAGWVARNQPSGMVVGAARWQLVLHDRGRQDVQVMVGFGDRAAAVDEATSPLPDRGSATSMHVVVHTGVAYVAGDDPAKEGPGRIWTGS